MTLLFLLINVVLPLTAGHPIDALQVHKTPTKEDATLLNATPETYEVYLSATGSVEYQVCPYYCRKKNQLPFDFSAKEEDFFDLGGKQTHLKIDDGWLVGFDKGEWGGSLIWVDETGSHYEKIIRGNIKNLFEIDGAIYAVEGLAHLAHSQGQILQIKKIANQWKAEQKIALPTAPFATTLTSQNEFLIVTSKSLLKIDQRFDVIPLIEEGFWAEGLYPNSILSR